MSRKIKLSFQANLKDEEWLFLPENKKILARIKKSLKEDATIDLGSFKKYLKE